MPVAAPESTRVYYEAHGEGPAIVLCHGAGGHHAIWWQQIPALRERYTVLALDFPGFGNSRSDRDEYDTWEYPEAILSVLDDAGIERAVLVGQSLGCPPSLSLTVAHPERVAGVVLAHSLGGIADEEVFALMRADRAQAEQLPVLDRLLTPRFQDAEPERVFLFQQLGSLNTATYGQLRNQWNARTRIAQVQEAIAAGVQVWFIAGGDDAVTKPRTYERLRELLPEAHYEFIAGAPHSMYWEAPEAFNATLTRILQTIHNS